MTNLRSFKSFSVMLPHLLGFMLHLQEPSRGGATVQSKTLYWLGQLPSYSVLLYTDWHWEFPEATSRTVFGASTIRMTPFSSHLSKNTAKLPFPHTPRSPSHRHPALATGAKAEFPGWSCFRTRRCDDGHGTWGKVNFQVSVVLALFVRKSQIPEHSGGLQRFYLLGVAAISVRCNRIFCDAFMLHHYNSKKLFYIYETKRSIRVWYNLVWLRALIPIISRPLSWKFPILKNGSTYNCVNTVCSSLCTGGSDSSEWCHCWRIPVFPMILFIFEAANMQQSMCNNV